MQTSTFVGLGALVLGGVLAGAALMDDGDEPAWGRDASGGYPTGSGPAVVDARLAEQLSALTADLEATRLKLDALELRLASRGARDAGAAALGADGAVTRDDLDALRTELLAALEARLDDPGVLADSQAFQDVVEGALSRIRRDELVAKVIADQDARVARLDEDVPRWAEWLELDANQSEQLRQALSARYAREEHITQMWRLGRDEDELARAKADNDQRFRDDLAGFLSIDQFETYDSSGK